ncbi:bifunctional ADP-dependent NAD(P)H-hydrate dehydratase/NAD(P)H-hydrate epimerase [Corynebacterium ulcerans]|uniref:bifunctional ADP-dependent NAD(P)H-hydrate dehydratase/NAD(P)H-hydrate epimerase n=1 Tax=Corynebacterium ulcerans TaxID=65058 RepID=UPI001303BAE8|nr:bifunctional ADP-dependent NAD(P)H-hydrate dehydratase/NAD(P)H-hydrate epimerase [Corynebacterium ulcerans]MBL4944609.1 bifunctional ADP-dependent NAD(P)H-hydrate dehydratase/NAD(P)H-hydrate epimerase [Corynebacterium ulcerans]QGZ26438.1 bifunctional ADP-dependent NAD(P)H-hydrate dehydratase/NAD(P)H-hydrate epimerase [Corynebacterium ulcerans]QOE23135.1 bifunctional ADP-dependent NAD(P)H-hydrate dehydratase/NAD(P)H-hydrate epimerase [Corynebacterium ulcerans]
MHAYSVADIRAAENPLIQAAEPDALMRQAAQAVAEAALCMIPHTPAKILVVAGSGGNGGDGLYAGALLAQLGHTVHAVLTSSSAHAPALAAFEQAGGVLAPLMDADLVIDAIIGLRGTAGLRNKAWDIWQEAVAQRPAILAVDVPSGVDSDTGSAGPDATCVTADVTITFGAARIAHAVSPRCGEVLVADIGAGQSLAQALSTKNPAVEFFQTLQQSRFSWPDRFLRPEPLHITEPLEPAAEHNKYSGGVVGVIAGSETYPGAAVLTATAAVHATPSMVRFVGSCARDVVRARPEVVATEVLIDAGRVQAWAYGPGAGDTDWLSDLLQRPEPLIIDADGITHLAQESELRNLLARRSAHGWQTLLTPHEGEFVRLAARYTAIRDVHEDRIGAVQDLAEALGCQVLLKGRVTIIGSADSVVCVNAGHSWAATPGSGDVLTGLIGAWVAHSGMGVVPLCVSIHAMAAWLSAQTDYGPAPTWAAKIADFIPQATAALLSQHSS